MSLERAVWTALSGSLALSTTLAFIRHEEEFARRAGLHGTRLMRAGDERVVEYSFTESMSSDVTIVLENGLGAALESWDWVARTLAPHASVLRYHRRGYARTKSQLSAGALLETLLARLSPGGPVVLVGHSIGALVVANALAQSRYLQSRVVGVVIIDGTDADLLAEDRADPRRRGRFVQDLGLELFASVTGMNRWVQSPLERAIQYLPDIQRAVLQTGTSPGTLYSASREYRHEPVDGQQFLARSTMPRLVVSAADNVKQQRTLASKLGADFSIVASSEHRSIIGKPDLAAQTAELIRSVA